MVWSNRFCSVLFAWKVRNAESGASLYFLQKGYLTYLLCGENGLCDSLDQVHPNYLELLLKPRFT